MSETASARRSRPHQWLAALPPLLMLGGVPFANRVEPYVLGLPFLLFWILLWVVLTSAVMGLIYALDQADARRAEGGGGAVRAASPAGDGPAAGAPAEGPR